MGAGRDLALTMVLGMKDKASKKLGVISGALGKLGMVTGGMLGMKGLEMIARGVSDITKAAVELPAVGIAFRSMGGDIKAMRKGVAGMITDAELMKQYNTAAQLVSKTFAQQLPDAMGYLGKVAASTGQDMAYLLNSLTVGVGRESKMILDNMAIQVDIVKAHKDYAGAIGTTVAALTEEQKKTGTMNQVLELLAQNTADMPDMVGSATQQWASLGAEFKNFTDSLGQGLLPILQEIMEVAGPLATRLREAVASESFINGVKRFADGISKVLDYVTSLEPETVKLAGAVGGAAIAFGAFNVVLALNPLVAVGAAIAGVVLAIDQLIKKHKDLVEDMRDAADATVDESRNYEEYKQKALGAARATEEASKWFGIVAKVMPITETTALNAGLIMQRWRWEQLHSTHEATAHDLERIAQNERKLANAMEDGALRTSQSMAELGHNVQGVTVSLKETAQAAQNLAFLNDQMAGSLEEVNLQGLRMHQVLTSAFSSDAFAGQWIQLVQTMARGQQDMLALQQQFQDTSRDSLFTYNLERAQAYQEYETQHTALLEAGRTDEAARLEGKFGQQKAMAERAYKIRQQLEARALLVQKIGQARAYVQELQDQRDQTIRVLEAEVRKSTKWLQLDSDRQMDILTIIRIGGSAALEQERIVTEQMLAYKAALARGSLEAAEDVALSYQLMATAAAGGAAQALVDLQTELENFSITLPPVAAPEFEAMGAGVTAATEPATRALSQVVSDIDQGIQAAQSAIEALVDFDLPEGIDTGLERMGAFMVQVVTSFYDQYDKVQPMLSKVKELTEPLTQVAQAMSGFASAMTATTASMEAQGAFEGNWVESFAVHIQRLKHASGMIYEWMNSIDDDTAKSVAKAAGVAENVKALFGLIGIDLTKIVPAAGAFAENAADYVRQLRHAGGLIFGWMREISKDISKALASAGKVSEDVKKLFTLVGINLAKIVPAEGAFAQNAANHFRQLRHTSGLIFGWMSEIKGQLVADVASAADVAENVRKLFALVGIDLAKIVPAEGAFSLKAKGYFRQMRHIGGLIYQWIQDIDTDARKQLAAAGDVAENVKKLFAVVGIDLSKMVPVKEKFGGKVDRFFAQLEKVGKKIMVWIFKIDDAARLQLEAAAPVAENIKKLFGVLGIDLSKIVPGGKNFMGNVTKFLDQIKKVTGLAVECMIEIRDKWGNALESAAETAGVIETVLQSMAGAVEANEAMANVGGFDVGAFMAMVNQFRDASSYLAAGGFEPAEATTKAIAGGLAAERGGGEQTLNLHLVLDIPQLGRAEGNVSARIADLETKMIDMRLDFVAGSA